MNDSDRALDAYLATPVDGTYAPRRRALLDRALVGVVRPPFVADAFDRVLAELEWIRSGVGRWPVRGRSRTPPWTPSEERQLAAEIAVGVSWDEIARRHGRSVGAVRVRATEMRRRGDLARPVRVPLVLDPDEAGIDKHERWRRRNRVAGRCIRCGRPARPNAPTCVECLRLRNGYRVGWRRGRRIAVATSTNGRYVDPVDNPEKRRPDPMIRPELQSALDRSLADRAARTPTDVAGMDWRSFLDVLAGIFEDGRISRDDVEPLIAYAEDAFETYVRPYNLPGVPDLIESFVDDVLKGLIRPAIAGLADRYLPA